MALSAMSGPPYASSVPDIAPHTLGQYRTSHSTRSTRYVSTGQGIAYTRSVPDTAQHTLGQYRTWRRTQLRARSSAPGTTVSIGHYRTPHSTRVGWYGIAVPDTA
eukprot:3377107-Rhodomonas_salina.13